MPFTPEQRHRLAEESARFGVTLSDAQVDQFQTLAELLLDWNTRVNLTALKSMDDVIDKHFIDSLAGVPMLPSKGVLLDIGTGAGFPGLPIKMVLPGLRVILIDGTGKKIAFVQAAVTALGLQGASGMHQRAEDKGFQFGLAGSIDVVTARAVSKTGDLAKLALPYLKKGGTLLLYKGVEEAAQVEASLFPGFHPPVVNRYQLPKGDLRAFVALRKS